MFSNDKKEKSPKQFIVLPYESERAIIDNRVENKPPKELIMDDVYKFLDYVYEMEMVVENIRNYLPDDDYLQKQLEKLDSMKVTLISEKDLQKK
jgi:hypothetical protein